MQLFMEGKAIYHFREIIALKSLPPMGYSVEPTRLKVTVLLSNGVHRLGTPASSELQLYLIIEGMQDCKERLCRIRSGSLKPFSFPSPSFIVEFLQ